MNELGGGKIRSARLLVWRLTLTGENDEADVPIVTRPKDRPEPLKPIAPGSTSFDAAEAVRQVVRQELEMRVESVSKWEAAKTPLEVAWDKAGAPDGVQKSDLAVQAFANWSLDDCPGDGELNPAGSGDCKQFQAA